MNSDGATSRQVEAALKEGTEALADALRQLEPATGPATVTRFHSPPQDHCDDLSCPCGLPPAGAVPVTVTDPGGPREGVAGWTSGQTSALITWRGWEGRTRPEIPGLVETWSRVTSDERELLDTLAIIRQQDNTELAGAWLLPGPPAA